MRHISNQGNVCIPYTGLLQHRVPILVYTTIVLYPVLNRSESYTSNPVSFTANRNAEQKVVKYEFPQPLTAARTKLHASSFSALTPSSRVTPWPREKVIRQRTKTLPPPPVTRPDSWSVCTDVDCGTSVPPNGSMLRISIIESQAAKRCYR